MLKYLDIIKHITILNNVWVNLSSVNYDDENTD